MGTEVLTPREFDAWLRGYKSAWEQRDPQAAAALFTDDAEYYWTPFDPPHRGKDGIAAVWLGAVSQQKDIDFTYDVLAVNGAVGIAHWHTKLTAVPDNAPVELDGIIVATFAPSKHCREFREWWHMPPAGK
jgi:ketosteroid isomerase-like protein